eukprot:173360-Heterocapsa_arctica.AAC.1
MWGELCSISSTSSASTASALSASQSRNASTPPGASAVGPFASLGALVVDPSSAPKTCATSK